MSERHSKGNTLSLPLTLPCGVVIKNRLVKSAMSDSLADGEGNPTAVQSQLYKRWAEGGVGLSIVGEVQVDARYPEKPGNLVLGDHSNLEQLKKLTANASINGAHIWPQLGHAGALSYQPLSQPTGPSAVTVNNFQCAEMSLDSINALPEKFAKSARIAKNAGFTGVQIHAAHGFLLSQFLSPLFNRRNDLYGGSVEARCRIIIEIIASVRKAVGHQFPIGIKINCTDQLEGGLAEDEALTVIKILNSTSLDLIEVSGGSYFPGAKSSSDSASNRPYFVEFAKQAKEITDIPLVVTGGFKNRQQALDVINSGATDSIGLGRAFILSPELANEWISETEMPLVFPKFHSPAKGAITAWYTMLLTAIATNKEQQFSNDLESALHAYHARDEKRVDLWRTSLIDK